MANVIHHFRPQLTDAAILEEVSVGREALLDSILDRLHAWEPGSSRQHWLIIGPRGIGKTHIVRLIERRIQQTPGLAQKWIPLCLAEEQYGIRNVADLLILVLERLLDCAHDPDIAEAYERVRHDPDDQRVVDVALDALRALTQRGRTGILLMVENLNRLLRNQIKSKQQVHLLRKILIEEDWLTLICTSPTFLNEVTEPEAPFFEFFDVKFLDELSRGQTEALMRKRAQLDGNTSFLSYLEQFRSRIFALYHFTGGNPRLTLMLYELLANRAITDVKGQLDMLLNELTPFYQDRMKELGPQEAGLLERMALMEEGCSPTELARELRMPRNQVSQLLVRLTQTSYVRLDAKIGRQSIYVIPERFVRIWNQMNHSRAARGRVQYLLEFFANWYATREERDREWDRLLDELEQRTGTEDDRSADDVSEYMEYLATVSEGSERFRRHFERLEQLYSTGGDNAVDAEFVKLDAEFRDDGDYFLHKGLFLGNVLRSDELALAAFRHALEFKRDDLEALFNKGLALKTLGHSERSNEAFTRAVELLSTERGDGLDATGVLLHIVEHDPDERLVWIASYLLTWDGVPVHWRDLAAVLKRCTEPWRRRRCATIVGFRGVPEAGGVLTSLLSDEAAEVRGAAATALGRIGDPATVAAVVDLLQDSAENVRGSAATALGRIGDPVAVPALMSVLGDPAWIVRAGAATALGRIGDAIAMPELVEALEDPADDVRASVATALGRIDGPAVVPVLIGALGDSAHSVRGSAAAALGRIVDHRAVLHLIEGLGHDAEDARRSAIFALRRVGTVDAISGLLKALPEIVHTARNTEGSSVSGVASSLLRAAFHAANIELASELVERLTPLLPDPDEFLLPYRIAIDYLRSGRERSILARQHPEMREAVQLLIDAFDAKDGA